MARYVLLFINYEIDEMTDFERIRIMEETCSLTDRECIPCKGGVAPLRGKNLVKLHEELGSNWEIISSHHLERTFNFDSYADAVNFTNEVARIAEDQGHHPDIYLGYSEVKVQVWTHKSDGLTDNDFVFAAKVNQLIP